MLSHENLWLSGKVAEDTGHVPGIVRSLTSLPLSHAFGLLVTCVGLHATEPSRHVLMRWFNPESWLELAQEHRSQIVAVVPSMLHLLLAQPLGGLRPVGASLHRVGRGAARARGRARARTPFAERGDPRGLRPDRDVRARLDDASRARPARRGRPAGSRDGGADPRRRGRRGADRRGRRDLLPLRARDARLLARPRADRGDDARRLAAHGRPRARRRGRLPLRRRPQEGPDHPRRLQRLPARRRGGAPRALRGRGRGGRRPPGPEVRRGGRGVRRAPRGARPRRARRLGAHERIGGYKYPREVHVVPALPLTPVGKVDRKALRARLHEKVGA